MAIVSDVEIRLRADIARLQQDMTAARRSVDTGMNGIAKSVDMAKKALGMLGVGLGIKELVSQVIDAQREFDKLHASLVTATGSAAGAANAFAALQRFAASTPYSVAEATESFIKLRNLGLNPSEAAMRSYGNTSAAMGKSLNQMIEAVADAATGQFERLKEFGVTAKQNGDKVMLTFQGVTKSIGNNAKDIQKYLLAIGDVNFGGAMESRTKTLDGAISNLGDTWSSTLRSMSSNGFGEGVMRGVISLSNALTDLSAIIDAVGGAASKEGEKMKEIGPLHQALTTVFETIAVLGVNVVYVFSQMGKELIGLKDMAVAVAHGDIKGAIAIGDQLSKEADAARKAVDAKSEAILGASAKAQAAQEKEAAARKAAGKDELAQYEIVLTAEQRRQKADADTLEIRNKLNGVDSQTAGNLLKLKTALDTGAISQKEYNRYVALTNKEATLASTAYKEGAKALDLSTEAVKRREQAQIAANKADQVMLDFLHKTGQMSDESFITKQADAEIKALNAQKAALQQQQGLLKSRYDTEAARAALGTQIEGKEQEIAAAKTKRENDLFELEQKHYREAMTNRADVIEAAQQEAQSQRQQTQAEQDTYEAMGLTGKELAALTARRLEDQAARADEKADLADLIEANGELSQAYRDQAEALRARAKLAVNTEELRHVQKFWGDVEQVAHDAFLSIGDSGKSMWQRLRDSGKSMFFEWLYQMTLKKWIINVGASFDGSAATAGLNAIGSASSAAGGGSILGTVGNLYGMVSGGMTLAGGLGSGFMGSLAGGLSGAGVGSGLTSAVGLQIGNSIASVVGPSVAGALSSGLGALAAAAPWVAGAVAVFALAKKAFGMGPKEFSGNSTLSGTIGGDGAMNANMLADWTKKGGWFRSDQHGVDKLPVDAALAAGITSTYQGIKDATMQYAKALGVNADSIADRAQALNIAFTKDDAANQKAISDFFTGVADTVASEVLPELSQFQRAGETVATTLQRLAANATGMDQVMAAMGTTSEQMFGAVGAAAIVARERLVALAGGIDTLAAQTAYYQQNILTEADRAKALQKPVADMLASIGYAGVTTTEQYKAAVDGLVSSGKVATEEGAKQYAVLMALAPQFKTVADYLKGVSDAAAQTAKDLADAQAAQEAAQRQAQADMVASTHDTLQGLADSAVAAVGRAVDAEKNRVSAAFKATMAALDAGISSVNDTIQRTGDLSKALKGAMVAQPGDNGGAQYQVARAAITSALAIAKASGVLPSAESLTDALATISQDNSDNFETLADYQRAVARTNAELEGLGGLTDNQLNTAQLQLQVLQDQKASTQEAYDAQIAQLDALVTTAQAQLDAVNGVNTSVLSTTAAVAALQTVLGALKSAPTAAGDTVAGITTVEDLYRKVLNRAPDAAGLAFWKNAYGDSVSQSEYLDFVKGAQPELQGMLKGPPDSSVPTASGTMSSGSAMIGELQTLNARMASVEDAVTRTAASTGQFAQQFHQVSAGGNALATESV